MIFRDFLEFVREQGVVGLAVGFVLGGAVKDVVTAFVHDILNPAVGVILGRSENLKALTVTVGGAEIRWGDFVAVVIDFLILASIIYFAIRVAQLQKLGRQKDESKGAW